MHTRCVGGMYSSWMLGLKTLLGDVIQDYPVSTNAGMCPKRVNRNAIWLLLQPPPVYKLLALKA